mmetsp:Transcript_39039/g.56963  ORF Transcript_39039/g.56963 Transcript_39039/m.56963 type:complete len:88 (+) Transcript_39039:319-582(+)
MTTGIRFLQISSGLLIPLCIIPTPALAVPDAAPTFAATIAMATPMYPKKGAKDGQESKSRSRLVFDMFQDKQLNLGDNVKMGEGSLD